MGLNDTPLAERVHIAFFGKRNAGKSSVVNAITNQNVAIVSNVKGTTTDPVYKTMEILPIGPVVVIDTPGLDDEGALGNMRIEKTNEVLRKTDIAVIVIDIMDKFHDVEYELIKILKKKNIPFIICFNKIDLVTNFDEDFYKSKFKEFDDEKICFVSAEKKENTNSIMNLLSLFTKDIAKEKLIISDLVNKNDIVVLVVPIDKAAPKGRLILPQQQVIRELLDNGIYCIVTRDTEFEELIKKYKKDINLVVTDSQVFANVSKVLPDDIPLTSFSILFSRYKGNIKTQIESLKMFEKLEDGDNILIAEGCTHRKQCGDIGTEKIPKALKKYTGKNLNIEFTSGGEFPNDLSDYKLVIHCGGCMLNNREMQSRIEIAKTENVAITNYGLFLAKVNGIFERAIKPILKNE